MISAAKIQKVLESYTHLQLFLYLCNQIRKSFLQKRRGIGILKRRGCYFVSSQQNLKDNMDRNADRLAEGERMGYGDIEIK